MVKHVLVPIDWSTQSKHALEYALAEYPDAEITALHVFNPGSYWYGDTDGYVYAEEVTDRLDERGQEVLETARAIATDHEREITTELELGTPAKTINEYAAGHDIDHIVIGSHGRDGIGRVLLGSVAERVARRSPVPVTILR